MIEGAIDEGKYFVYSFANFGKKLHTLFNRFSDTLINNE